MGKKKISQFPNKATPVAADKFLIEDASGNYYYTTESQLASVIGGASGDMLKSVYDVDNTGVVDNAEAIKIVGRNSTGATLRKGTIIYINGSTGNRPNFVKAQANSEATSAGTFGVIDSDLPNNSDGYALCLGYLDNLDTRITATYPFTSDTLVDGDTIYLSPTTAGYITNVKPSAPNHLVYLGKVTRTSPTNGTIVYRIQNGYELNEIHDVQDTSYSSPIDADSLLIKDSTNSLWKRLTFANLKTYLTGLFVDLTTNQTVAGQKTFSEVVTVGSSGQLTTINPIANTPIITQTGTTSSSFNTVSGTRSLELKSWASDTNYLTWSGATFRNYTTGAYGYEVWNNGVRKFQISNGGLVIVDAHTANRVVVTGASKELLTSSVTDTTLGYLDATSSIQTQLNGKLSTTITSVAKGDTIEYNGSAWVNVPIQYTVELIDALTIDIYAPYGMKINSVTNILNSPTTTILVGGSAYTLGNTITTGQKITVTVSVAAVVTLNINKV